MVHRANIARHFPSILNWHARSYREFVLEGVHLQRELCALDL